MRQHQHSILQAVSNCSVSFFVGVLSKLVLLGSILLYSSLITQTLPLANFSTKYYRAEQYFT